VTFETLLSIGTVESVTLIESFSLEIAGPLVTSIGGGIAIGGVVVGVLLVIGGVGYVLAVNEE
jgi:hypothetical protein